MPAKHLNFHFLQLHANTSRQARVRMYLVSVVPCSLWYQLYCHYSILKILWNHSPLFLLWFSFFSIRTELHFSINVSCRMPVCGIRLGLARFLCFLISTGNQDGIVLFKHSQCSVVVSQVQIIWKWLEQLLWKNATWFASQLELYLE